MFSSFPASSHEQSMNGTQSLPDNFVNTTSIDSFRSKLVNSFLILYRISFIQIFILLHIFELLDF